MNLAEIAKELNCSMRNPDSIDLENSTFNLVMHWLESNGFIRLKAPPRNGTIIFKKDQFIIRFDTIGGFLYT